MTNETKYMVRVSRLGFLSALALTHCALTLMAQSTGTFTATGSMTIARAGHTATLLTNGKVLIAGGVVSFGSPLSAELYDPTAGTFTPTGNMTTARRSHTATLLADGRVLIGGGFVGLSNSPTASAELYDPSSGTFTPAGEVGRAQGQAWHTATLLNNGRVLIAGIGMNAELYDPETGTISDTGPYADTSVFLVETATLLPDGRVLITGCAAGCSAGLRELYDPRTNTFSLTTGTMSGTVGWWGNVNTATLLMNGKVLIAGSDEYDWPADAEVYDPSTATFTGIGNTAAPHEFATATLLPDGTVLIAGSQLPGGSGLASVEFYDPVTSAFSAAGNMSVPRHSQTATLLPDGMVLIAGGYSVWPDATSSAELYKPPLPQPAAALLSLSGDGQGQGAILHAGTPQVASSSNRAHVGEALEIYCTGLADGSVIPPQITIGGRMAEILFFGKAPGFAGLNQVNVRVPSGVAPGPTVPVRLIYLNRPSNEVTIGVQ